MYSLKCVRKNWSLTKQSCRKHWNPNIWNLCSSCVGRTNVHPHGVNGLLPTVVCLHSCQKKPHSFMYTSSAALIFFSDLPVIMQCRTAQGIKKWQIKPLSCTSGSPPWWSWPLYGCSSTLLQRQMPKRDNFFTMGCRR